MKRRNEIPVKELYAMLDERVERCKSQMKTLRANRAAYNKHEADQYSRAGVPAPTLTWARRKEIDIRIERLRLQQLRWTIQQLRYRPFESESAARARSTREMSALLVASANRKK